MAALKMRIEKRISASAKDLGVQFRKARKRQSLSPSMVATKAGICVGYLYRIESGKVETVLYETAKAIESALGLDLVDKLFMD